MKSENKPENTAFLEWREKAKLNRRQAAEKLGLRPTMVVYLDNDHFEPRPDTRLLMDAVARKITLKPWRPE